MLSVNDGRAGLRIVLLAAAGLAAPAQAQTGACCLDAVGACAVMTQQDCDSAGGRYEGNGTDCAAVVCERYVRTLRGTGSAAGIGQFIDIMPDGGGAGAGGSILITGFDYHVTSSSSAGAPLMLDVWTHRGTYREAESYDPAKWRLHETLHGTSVGGGPNIPVRVNLATPLLVQQGRTRALFLHSTLGTMHFRANVQRNPTIYDNGETRLYSERYRFGTGGGGWNGNISVGRDFHGAVYYIPADGSITGACCLPLGACQQLSLDACTTQSGIFHPETDCSAVVCEEMGVCCLPDGACALVFQEDCGGRNQGLWIGAGTNCSFVDCAIPGACCFPGQSCAILQPDDCTAAGGAYLGGGSTCAWGQCWSAPILWNNGPLDTGNIVGGQPAPAGTSFSEIQPGNVLFGANTYRVVLDIPGGFTVADDFIISDPAGWQIDEITVFGFRQHTAGAEFTRAYLEIWDGPPNDPSASVVFGDQMTDRMIDATFANLYRVAADTPTLNRFIYAIRLNVNTPLPSGHYWLRYSLEVQGNEAFASVSPFVTMIGSRSPAGANAMQSLGGIFHPLLDDINLPLVPQELPFIITGSAIVNPCYANCDLSTIAPILNVDDFTCFINEFAQAQGLPHQQQIVHYANCDGSTTAPVLNVDDFTCFINAFAQGCR